ncbi:MAG TPA: ATP-dependent DNA ligase [Candidatus Angelobacter sp.]|jgi:ATP-dependent DNA ligase|nr:ATP-dependent DNA ligase [Candidatus Angelobacter sp.]
MASPRKHKAASVESAPVPAEALEHAFPKLNLPIQPPYPPAEAKSVKDLPRGSGWLYEPKWDGFRCLAFRQGDEVILQSKAGQPLGRYFPEIVAALLALPARKFVLDGEIVIRQGAGLDFDALLQRIHPAASRIQRLSQETPATYMVFDLLVDGHLVENKGRSLVDRPLSARRMALQEFAAANISPEPESRRSKKAVPQANSKSAGERITLSPASSDFATAEKWMREGAASGWDGVVAKRLDCEYMSGERTGMAKIKRIRTAECVVGGFRWARRAKNSSDETANSKKADSENAGPRKRPTEEVGSLLLGLYNKNGELDHIGFSASFTREERKKLKSILKPFMGGTGFSGKAPGGPSRWTRDARDTEWIPLKPKLVGEFQYDHFSGGRFRHGTKFLRWRPEKKPEQCTMEQIRPANVAG